MGWSQVARQPKASFDRQRGRVVINWRIKGGLHVALTPEVSDRLSHDCKWYRDRLPQSTTPEQAAVIEAERLTEYYAILQGARDILANPERRAEILARLADEAAGMMLAQGDRLIALQAGMRKLHADHEAVRRVAALGGVMQPPATPPGGKIVDSNEVIQTWIAKRTKDKDPPKRQAIQAKRSKLARLFAFLHGVNLPDRLREEQIADWLARGNIAVITESDIKRYLRKLMMDGGQREYDGYVDLISLFGVARRYDLITSDPFENVDPPLKIRRKNPVAMSDAEARAVLPAAREAIGNGDVLQWAHPLSALTGGINSEILEAMATEFYQIEAGLPHAGQWVWDMRSRRLKDSREGEGSGFRPRLIPLHSVLIEKWEFPAYIASRKGKPLFDQSVGDGTNKLNAFISAALTEAGIETHRTFYAWRHRVHNKMGDDVLARYFCGHATDIHQDYMTPELPEEYTKVIQAVEDRLVDPEVT